MTKLIDYTLLTIAGSALLGFTYWAWKDIVRDRRPEVTEEDIDDAFCRMMEENDFIFDD